MSPLGGDDHHLEQRKEQRTWARRAGWIAVIKGGPLVECQVLDESDSGARLVLDTPRDLPDVFFLYFSLDFASRRHCRVAWRSDNQVGVQFGGGGR